MIIKISTMRLSRSPSSAFSIIAYRRVFAFIAFTSRLKIDLFCDLYKRILSGETQDVSGERTAPPPRDRDE